MRVPHPTDVFETSRGEFCWGSGTNNDSEARALGDLLEMLIGLHYYKNLEFNRPYISMAPRSLRFVADIGKRQLPM